MKPKILITGANGYIGSALASTLLEKKDFSKIVLACGPSKNNALERLQGIAKNKKANAELETVSILDFEKISSLLKGIDVVVHAAFMHTVDACEKKPEESRRINIEGTHGIVKACEENSVKKFVFPSSILVYGYAEGKLTEETALAPQNTYAKQKAECENFISKSKLNYIILRKSNVYGVGFSQQFDTVIPSFVVSALREKKITVFGTGQQQRNFLHISDAIAAYEKAIFSDYSGILNIGSAKETKIIEIAGLIAKKLGAEIVHVENPRNEPEKRKWHYCSEKAKKALDFEAKKRLEKGLGEFIAWAKKNKNSLP